MVPRLAPPGPTPTGSGCWSTARPSGGGFGAASHAGFDALGRPAAVALSSGPDVDIRHAEAVGVGPAADPPLFRWGVPADVRGRWRLIRALVERWFGFPLADAGGQPVAVARWESELGRRLPASVREWAALEADLPGDRFERVFRDPFGLEWRDDLDALAVLAQAEGDLHWVVRADDLADPDPPVFLLLAEHAYVWLDAGPFTPTLADFVLGHILTYLEAEEVGESQDPAGRDAVTARLAAEYPVRGRFDSWEVFEGDGAAAAVFESDNSVYHWRAIRLRPPWWAKAGRRRGGRDG